MEIVVLSSFLVLVFIFIGIPVAFSFLSGSIIYLFLTGSSMGAVVPRAFFSLDSYTLLAIPLFMIAGGLMEASGIANTLIDFAHVLLKKVKGGMGATIPVASMFFGALSGSGTATVAALSTIMLPRLEKLGWDKRYTSALLGAAGPLGYMIPPNMNAILFALVADVSVAALFLASVIPGILWGLLYVVINRFTYAKWYDPDKDESLTKVNDSSVLGTAEINSNKSYGAELFSSFKSAIPAFIMPGIILGGIYGGIFTPTEAGAVACIYGILAGVFIFKRLGFSNGFSSFIKTAMTLGSIFVILPMVKIFTRLLVINGIPQMIGQSLVNISPSAAIALLMIDVVFFVSGFFLDAGILILVITPLFVPAANLIGLNTIQLGVIMFTAVGVGTVTPPMAMNLFVTSKASGVPLQDMFKPLWPFVVFGAVPILLLVTYVPALSLWLPKVVMGIKI